VEAASDERLRELAGPVRGEDDDGPRAGAERPELRHAHLEVGQHFEQERLELRVGLVDLVDQQHDFPGCHDRPEERPLEEIVGREDVAGDVLPALSLGAVGLDAQELLLVVPLVERARLVEPS